MFAWNNVKEKQLIQLSGSYQLIEAAEDQLELFNNS